MNAYLKFLRVSHELEDSFINSAAIGLRELKLAEFVALRYRLNLPLTVTETMHASRYGSPAAIHRALRKLQDAGAILIFSKDGNRRTKYLMPSDLTLHYFELQGQSMVDCACQAA